MGRVSRSFLTLVAVIMFVFNDSYALIGPIRVLPSGHVLLVSSDEIKLSEEHLDLYHHPLGIWLIEYRALLTNLRSQEIVRPVGFPSGFDIRLIESELHCDRFENFKVMINDQPVTDIDVMVRCSNYISTTGTQWSVDDGSAAGFLNTWELTFKPEEQKWIKITFSFIVKKAPPIFKPNITDPWQVDLVNWVKQDYASREENDFQLPLNIGSFWALYPDSIIIRTYVADDWLRVKTNSERHYQPELVKKYEYSEPVGFYSPPAIPLDTLRADQVQAMSPTELILLKNAFFAKYGRRFQNALVQKYFDAQAWYSENPNYHHWYLTPWDLDNIKLINENEEARKQNKTTSRSNN